MGRLRQVVRAVLFVVLLWFVLKNGGSLRRVAPFVEWVFWGMTVLVGAMILLQVSGIEKRWRTAASRVPQKPLGLE